MRRERALLTCGVAGPLVFLAVALGGSLFPPPGYHPLRHTVSAFALGGFGWVQRASFLVSGALVIAGAVGLRAVVRREGGGPWPAVLVGLIGIGLVGAGLFVADPVAAGATAAFPYPPGMPVSPDRTVTGVLHDLFGVPVFLGLPIACGVVARRMAVTGRRAWAAYSAGTGVAYAALFVLTGMALAQPPLIAPIGGLLQRLTLCVGFVWLAALAASRLRRARVTPDDPTGTPTTR